MPNPDRTVSDVVYRRQIPETIIEGRRLGRHVHHDPRSLSFPATQLTSAGLQDEADKLGGCWVIEHNMHIGFLFIHQLQKEYGLEGGFQHYNGSGPAAKRPRT